MHIAILISITLHSGNGYAGFSGVSDIFYDHLVSERARLVSVQFIEADCSIRDVVKNKENSLNPNSWNCRGGQNFNVTTTRTRSQL